MEQRIRSATISCQVTDVDICLQITYYDASKAFVEKVQAKDKTFMSYPGYFHELHNEVIPPRLSSIQVLS